MSDTGAIPLVDWEAVEHAPDLSDVAKEYFYIDDEELTLEDKEERITCRIRESMEAEEEIADREAFVFCDMFLHYQEALRDSIDFRVCVLKYLIYALLNCAKSAESREALEIVSTRVLDQWEVTPTEAPYMRSIDALLDYDESSSD